MTHRVRFFLAVSTGLLGIAGYFAYLMSLTHVTPPEMLWDGETQVDVLIVLSGDPGNRRTLRAVELHRRSVAERVLISGAGAGGDSAEYLGEVAVDAGLEPSDLLLEPKAKSTWENLSHSRGLMERHGFDSAVIVTSDSHARRVAAVAAEAFRGIRWSLELVPTTDRDSKSRALEVLKTLRYAALGRLSWSAALGGAL